MQAHDTRQTIGQPVGEAAELEKRALRMMGSAFRGFVYPHKEVFRTGLTLRYMKHRFSSVSRIFHAVEQHAARQPWKQVCDETDALKAIRSSLHGLEHRVDSMHDSLRAMLDQRDIGIDARAARMHVTVPVILVSCYSKPLIRALLRIDEYLLDVDLAQSQGIYDGRQRAAAVDQVRLALDEFWRAINQAAAQLPARQGVHGRTVRGR